MNGRTAIMPYTPKDATPATARANRDAAAGYDLADRQDFTDADQGLIARFPGPVTGADGHVISGGGAYEYLTDDAAAPDTADPSLWRQSQIMRRGGLYKVTEGLYQARNNDIADLTIVEGDTGLVIIDCTAGVECPAGHGPVPRARQRQAGSREVRTGGYSSPL
jgi:alkyl sulfatase BDS1-like metallo-beta-lactamase superfamily hydrolase